jgi:hypothetical protein
LRNQSEFIDGVFEEFPGNDFAHEEMGNLERNRGRLAEAARHYRIVHFARPGDPYAAAQIAMIGVTVNDPVMVEQWIAAARESGALTIAGSCRRGPGWPSGDRTGKSSAGWPTWRVATAGR